MTTMIHRRDLLTVLGICSRTLARWADKGKLPPPDVDINPRSQWWKPETLEKAGISCRTQS
jgi:predicted site-specific integrase-resolvase